VVVDKETFSYWVTRPDDLTVLDFQQLQASVQQWPYCQALYTLTAKAASQHQHPQTIAHVRQAAAHALSRNALRKLIENEFQWSDNLLTKLNELSQRQVPIPDDYQHESYALYKSRARLTDRMPTLSLLTFPQPTRPVVDDNTRAETALQTELVAQSLPVAEDEIPKMDADRQQQLTIIENFIRNEPSIPRVLRAADEPDEDPEPVDLAEQRLVPSVGFVTESFALILIRQGKIDKAIAVYEQLIQQNPAKKAIFAAKIAELTQNRTT
jgi:tetratricopeptide (TPR) repeat protein